MHASFFTGRLVALAAIASAVVGQSTSWQQSTAASLTPLDDLFIGEARHFTFEEHLDELERLSAGSELELLVMDIGPELRADTFDSIREGGLFTGVAWDMLIFWVSTRWSCCALIVYSWVRDTGARDICHCCILRLCCRSR
ncbi:hypothetical protein DFH29DRAFT_967201 [Suillus ampliporus]|nr:hypothetical protein DFH29DRAFT_967201 [Suillus ampliporus]